MHEQDRRGLSPDDTAAFRRYYEEDPADTVVSHGLLYRVLIGWWRGRS